MELALCLVDNTNKFSFLEKPSKLPNNLSASSTSTSDKNIGFNFNMDLDVLSFGGQRSLSSSSAPSVEDEKKNIWKLATRANDFDELRVSSSVDPSLQLQLHFPWLPEDGRKEGRMLSGAATVPGEEEEAAPSMSMSPPDSVTSSFGLDFGIKSYGYEGRDSKRDIDDEVERSTSRASNEDNDEENGAIRKKLRLSKDQSAFLEDSFKEHNTLNPKQKIALAKQLNLRPRQVEVWFQNRRARGLYLTNGNRTKLKQTEVDCEYLKKCCESLTEENRRLQKEVKELRALKISSPFYMQRPATTLTMCPSCERVATTSSQPSTSAARTINLST